MTDLHIFHPHLPSYLARLVSKLLRVNRQLIYVSTVSALPHGPSTIEWVSRRTRLVLDCIKIFAALNDALYILMHDILHSVDLFLDDSSTVYIVVFLRCILGSRAKKF